MVKRLLLVILSLLFLLFLAVPALGDGTYGPGSSPQSGTITPQCTISPRVKLILAGQSNVTWTSPATEDLPVTKTGNITATVYSDYSAGWSLNVSKGGDLTGITTSNIIPSSRFTFSSAGSPDASYNRPAGTQFATSPGTQIGGDAAGSPCANGVAITASYSLQILWTDVADTYSATHTYTLASP